MKVEAIQYGDRKVYTVASFNRGVADWLSRLPTIWVEGEVTELRRNPRWQSVFFTLKDPTDGACLGVTIARSRFDALRLDLTDGERVHVFGRPDLFEAKGDFRMRALSIERFGLGDHLAALERLKKKLAAEGVFERKRPLPFLPRRIGLVTGNDAAAKRDVLTTITTRFPAARVVVAETYVQGPFAATAMIDALREPSARRRRSTSSCSHAAAAASRTCSRSATSGSCAPSPPARCRSSPPSGTSRTRRCAISPLTPVPRRRPQPAGSSSRTRRNC